MKILFEHANILITEENGFSDVCGATWLAEL